MEKANRKLLKRFRNIQNLFNEKKLQILYLKFLYEELGRKYEFLSDLCRGQGSLPLSYKFYLQKSSNELTVQDIQFQIKALIETQINERMVFEESLKKNSLYPRLQQIYAEELRDYKASGWKQKQESRASKRQISKMLKKIQDDSMNIEDASAPFLPGEQTV